MTNGDESNVPDRQASPSGITPRIISETDHPIRRNDLDREALKVLYRLRDAGFAGYLVGGGVRDIYLGKKPKDFDISTDAHPGQLRKLFRNSRTIGRRFRLVQVFFRGSKIIEVSTLRSQSEYDIKKVDKVLPANNTFGTLGEDAFRRDLTVNSLFYEIENSTIIDYVGGVDDLDKGIIRIVGEPERRITRDPVRMMRAIRHGARNNFNIEDDSWQAIVRNRQKLSLCPPSRIRDELIKDLRGGCSYAWFQLALKSKIFFTLLPFYEKLIKDKQPADSDVKEMLVNHFKVLDRLHSDELKKRIQVKFADHMLLAFLLVPWALIRFDLMNRHLKGPGQHRLLQEIRSDLTEIIGEQFHLKRMAKEEIARLLLNLAVFRQYLKNGSWPKWLQKKSYFTDSSRFYKLYIEASGGDLIDPLLFVEKRKNKKEILRVTTTGKRSKGRHRGTQPSFSSQKGGVFGLV